MKKIPWVVVVWNKARVVFDLVHTAVFVEDPISMVPGVDDEDVVGSLHCCSCWSLKETQTENQRTVDTASLAVFHAGKECEMQMVEFDGSLLFLKFFQIRMHYHYNRQSGVEVVSLPEMALQQTK